MATVVPIGIIKVHAGLQVSSVSQVPVTHFKVYVSTLALLTSSSTFSSLQLLGSPTPCSIPASLTVCVLSVLPSLTDSSGHVQSTSFSLSSGLFQMPLAALPLISTIKAFPLTVHEVVTLSIYTPTMILCHSSLHGHRQEPSFFPKTGMGL